MVRYFGMTCLGPFWMIWMLGSRMLFSVQISGCRL